MPDNATNREINTLTEPPQLCANCELTRIDNVDREFTFYRGDGERIGDCCRGFYRDCHECGELEHRSTMSRTGDTGRYFCEDCTGNVLMWDEESERYYQYDIPNNRNIIHDYSYRPPTVFHFVTWNTVNPSLDKLESTSASSYRGGSTVYAGLEIEVEDKDETGSRQVAADLLELMDSNDDSKIYLKEDSSLNNGFEIVTQPRTRESWEKSWDDFKPVFDIKKDGFRSHDTSTCGLHISLSRRAFNPSHLNRFQKMVYFNPDFIRFLSRRKMEALKSWGNPYALHDGTLNLTGIESRYIDAKMGLESAIARETGHYKQRAERQLARLEKEHLETPFLRDNLGGFFINHRNEVIYTSKALATDKKGARGTAVNLTGERVELRFFRGTLKKETLKMNVEFSFFAYDFARDTAADSLTVQNMIHYAEKHNYNRVFDFLDSIPWGTRQAGTNDFIATSKAEQDAKKGMNPTIKNRS